MRKIGELSRSAYESETINIPLKDLKPGINDYNDFFIKYSDEKVEYIIDKICDHAGGRLVRKGDKAICPMHNWILDLDCLEYEGSNNAKKTLNFAIENESIVLKKSKYEIGKPI